jgi:IS30 family transposase
MSLIEIEVSSMTMLNEKKLKQIDKLSRSGKSIRQIAKLINTSKSTVQRYLNLIQKKVICERGE